MCYTFNKIIAAIVVLLWDLWHFEKRQLSPMINLVANKSYDFCATQKTTNIIDGAI